MKKFLLICCLFVSTLNLFGQNDLKTAVRKFGPNPLFILDSQKVSQSKLSNYYPDSIATIVVLYDTSATKLYGDSAKDGAVIFETRSFARRMFISFFRKSSRSYDSLYNAIGADTSFAYIINDKVQTGSYEGNLSSLNDQLFDGLEIINKENLYSKFNVNDKKFGILVRTKKPKDLYNADK
jgi:hypothetical protein